MCRVLFNRFYPCLLMIFAGIILGMFISCYHEACRQGAPGRLATPVLPDHADTNTCSIPESSSLPEHHGGWYEFCFFPGNRGIICEHIRTLPTVLYSQSKNVKRTVSVWLFKPGVTEQKNRVFSQGGVCSPLVSAFTEPIYVMLQFFRE